MHLLNLRALAHSYFVITFILVLDIILFSFARQLDRVSALLSNIFVGWPDCTRLRLIYLTSPLLAHCPKTLLQWSSQEDLP